MNIYLTKKVVKFNKKNTTKKNLDYLWYSKFCKSQKQTIYATNRKLTSHSPEYDLKKSTFNNYRNLLRRTIWLAKKNYFCKTFTDSKNNMKRHGKNINKVLNRNSNKFSPETLTIDNQICTDKTRNGQPFQYLFYYHIYQWCANNNQFIPHSQHILTIPKIKFSKVQFDQ